MSTHDTIFEVDVSAERQAVAAALTTESGIKGWWTDRVTMPAQVGGVLLPSFPGAPAPFDLQLSESGAERIVWTPKSFPPPWVGTSIVWDLAAIPEGTGTRIAFSHRGWDSASPTIGSVAFTWGQLLVRLKEYVETGQPRPFFVS